MNIDPEYNVVISSSDQLPWNEVVSYFRDANLYQTSSYDLVRYGSKGIVNMRLMKANRMVAAVQIRVVRLPLIRAGVAYIFWGPMWKHVDGDESLDVFRQTVRALRNEFSKRLGLALRIYPIAFKDKDDSLKQILLDEGYRFYNDGRSHRTLLVDLSPQLEEIRSALDQKWRNCLNRAEKNELEIVSGTNEALFDEISKIYIEMASRKGLTDLSDIEYLKKVQRGLPEQFKLRVILCRSDHEVCAGAIFSAMGTMAVYLIGATSNVGMKSNGSYMIQWSFIKWLKENGFLYYDLNGINPAVNPGTYHFKKGLAGKKGMDLEFLGKYQVADSLLSAILVRLGEKLATIPKKVRQKIKSQRA